jgi:hypothetical protein
VWLSVLVPALIVGLVAGLIGGTGCRRDDSAARRDQRVSTLVVAKVMPAGKLVGAAAGDGTFTLSDLPGDVVPDDAMASVAGIPCLVAARSLPNGTIVRRSLFVEPQQLGLDEGLTEGSSRPEACPAPVPAPGS